MSIIAIPYLKKIGNWIDKKIFPVVRDTNLLIEYSHSQSSTKEKTIEIEYLDSNNNVVTSEKIVDDLGGSPIVKETKALFNFRIKVTNTSNVTLNVTLNITNTKLGAVNVWSSKSLGATGSLQSEIFEITDRSERNLKVFRNEELLNFNVGNTFTTQGGSLKNEVTSILVDEKGNYYLGRIQNGNNLPSLEKYDSYGNRIWFRNQLKSTLFNGSIIKIVKDNNGNIYSIDSLGKVFKNDSLGNDAEWTHTFGSFFMRDITIDIDGNIYAVGNNILKKLNPDGDVLWTYQIGTNTLRTVNVKDDFVYVCRSNSTIEKLDQSLADESTEPTVEWSQTTFSIGRKVEISGNRIYIKVTTATKNNIYYGIIKADGTGLTLELLGLDTGLFGNIIPDEVEGFYFITRGVANEVRRYDGANNISWIKPLECIGGNVYGQPITRDNNGNIIYGSWGRITKIKADKNLTGYITK